MKKTKGGNTKSCNSKNEKLTVGVTKSSSTSASFKDCTSSKNIVCTKKENRRNTTVPIPSAYNVRSGTIEFGKEYEIKVAALLALRCCGADTANMWLGINIDEGEDFDDIVLYRQTPDGQMFTYLMQLKFQTNPRNLEKQEFALDKGNFSLKKYLQSISNINEHTINHSSSCDTHEIIDHFKINLRNMLFIIFTNRKLVDTSFCNKVKRSTWLHKVVSTGIGSIFQFDWKKLKINAEASIEKYKQNLFLLTNQILVQDLDAAIKEEIKELTKSLELPTALLAEVSNNFILFITNWSKGLLGGHYLLTKNIIWRVILESVLKHYIIEFSELERNEILEYNIWNKIIQDKQITIVSTHDIVDYYLKNYIYHEVSSYIEYYKNLRLCRKDEVQKLLLRTINNSEDLESYEIYEYLWKSCQIPLIIKVSASENLETTCKLLERFQEYFRIIVLIENVSDLPVTTNFKTFKILKDLNEEHQAEVLQQTVKLQSRLDIKLADVITEDMYHYLSVKDIIFILSGSFSIGNPSSADYCDTFIERSVEKVWLKSEVLQKITDDTFIIKCDSLHYFQYSINESRLRIKNSRVYKWKNFESIFDCWDNNNNIIIFESDYSIDKALQHVISKSRNVHCLILHNNRHFEWIKSFGQTQNIKQFRDNSSFSNSEYQNVDELINSTDYQSTAFSKLITGCPGMGKSCLLNYISIRASTNSWILKTNLSDHTDFYASENIETLTTIECILDFATKLLSHQNCDYITRNMFKKFFECRKVIFLLDAYDEVPISYQKNAKKIIKEIQNAGFSVCVTTRPVLKTELEELLNTFAVDIKPFSTNDQITFLTKHFSKISNTKRDDERLVVFIHKLLEATKQNLNDQDLEFTGVPLLTKLLVEVFTNDYLSFLKSGHFMNQKFDLIYLYKHFTDQKVKLACKKFGKIAVDMLADYKIHNSYYALQLLFSEEDLNPLNVTELLKHEIKFRPKALQMLQKDGMVVPENENKVRFVHRTFAEYLVAEWLFENINTEHKEIVHRLIIKVFEPSFVFVRNMFDRMLAIDCPLHIAVINADLNIVKEIIRTSPGELNKVDKGGRSVLHTVAAWGVHHPVSIIKPLNPDLLKKSINGNRMLDIFKLIPSNLIRSDKDSLLEFTPLDYAVSSSSLNIADAICEKSEYLNQDISTTNVDFGYMSFYVKEFCYGSLASVLIRHSVLKDSNEFMQKVKLEGKDADQLQNAIRNRNLQEIETLICVGHDINIPDNLGCTPLHVSTILKNEAVVNLLLENNANLNVQDSTGKTALHWAALTEQTNIICLLLAHLVDTNIKDNKEMTAFHCFIIAANNKSGILELILTKPRYFNFDMSAQDIYGKTLLHYALHYNQKENLKSLLIYGSSVTTSTDTFTAKEGPINYLPKILSYKDLNGATVLHWAAGRGLLDVINLFLENGAFLSERDDNDRTALLCAVEKGHTAVVKLLLQKNAHIEYKVEVLNCALMGASRKGHATVVNLLLDSQADIEAKDNKGMTSLHWASLNGHTEVVQLLLNKGANFEVKCERGRTALAYAAIKGHTTILNVLLDMKDEVEAKDDKNSTTLHWAALNGHVEVVQLLLDKGVNSEIKNNYGKTALAYASMQGHTAVVNLLLNKQAEIDTKAQDGMTCLHLAAFKGRIDVFQLLLSKGANSQIRDKRGNTALMYASERGRTPLVTLLLNNPEDIEIQNNEGKTCLHLAASSGHADIVQLLLNQGLNFEIKDNKAKTALMYASEMGHTAIVNLLLNRQADTEAKNSEGKTSLHLAAFEGHTDIVQLLLDKGANFQIKDNLGKTAFMYASEAEHIAIVNLLLSKQVKIEARNNVDITL